MTDYDHYRFVKVENDDGVATLTLNRPERRNAAHEAMHRELEDVFRDVGEDDDIRAIVLTGAGEHVLRGR